MIINDWSNTLDVAYMPSVNFIKSICFIFNPAAKSYLDKDQRAPTSNHTLRLNIQHSRGSLTSIQKVTEGM